MENSNKLADTTPAKKSWDVPKYNIENFTLGDYVENTEKYEMFN